MNPANLHDAIVSAWPLLNDLLIVGVAVALIAATVTCVFREFGTRRVKFL
jgi:hypothetical protein